MLVIFNHAHGNTNSPCQWLKSMSSTICDGTWKKPIGCRILLASNQTSFSWTQLLGAKLLLHAERNAKYDALHAAGRKALSYPFYKNGVWSLFIFMRHPMGVFHSASHFFKKSFRFGCMTKASNLTFWIWESVFLTGGSESVYIGIMISNVETKVALASCLVSSCDAQFFWLFSYCISSTKILKLQHFIKIVLHLWQKYCCIRGIFCEFWHV